MKIGGINIVKSKEIAWVLWLGWTGLLCFLFLSPSKGTVRNISSFFGGTEITDAIGHIILIGIDCLLLYILARHYQAEKLSQRLAFIITLIIGLLLETAQIWIPSRGASLIDIIAAIIGVSVAGLLINRCKDYLHFATDTPH